MAEADSQVLAMEQDPEDVMLKEDEEIGMDNEIQEHVADELQAGDGLQAVVAELDNAADVELQEAEFVQVDDVQVYTAEVVQVTEMMHKDQVIQPDWEIKPVGDEGHSGEWMQDGKSLDGQVFYLGLIPDLEKVEKFPEVGVQCR